MDRGKPSSCIFAAFVHFVTCLLFVCWFLFHTFNYFSFSTILTIHVFLHRISTSLSFLDNRFFGTILHFLLSSFAELQYAAVSNDYRIFCYYYYFFLFFLPRGHGNECCNLFQIRYLFGLASVRKKG